MQTLGNLVTGLAAIGLGFVVGGYRTFHAANGGDGPRDAPGAAVTFLGGETVARDKSAAVARNALGLISFTTYAEARDRLEELLGALHRLSDHRLGPRQGDSMDRGKRSIVG